MREQGGIFKNFLDQADPYKRAGYDFFKSGKWADPNKQADLESLAKTPQYEHEFKQFL